MKSKMSVIQIENSNAYNSLISYLKEYQNNACWSANTITEFWRMFIDANQQAAGKLQFGMGESFYTEFDEMSGLTKEQLESISAIKPYLVDFQPGEKLGEALYRLKLNGIVPFENREKGYLKGMTKAYQFLSEQSGIKLNIELIKTIHANAMSGVKDTLCPDDQIGCFRQEDAYMSVQYTRQTQDGVDNYLRVLDAGEAAFEFFITDKARTYMKDRICYHEKSKSLIWKSIRYKKDPQAILDLFQKDINAFQNDSNAPQVAIDFLNGNRPYIPENFKVEFEKLLDHKPMIDFEIKILEKNQNILLRRYKFTKNSQDKVSNIQCSSFKYNHAYSEIRHFLDEQLEAIETGKRQDSLLSLRSPAPEQAKPLDARLQEEIVSFYQKLEAHSSQLQNKNHLLYNQLFETISFIQTLCRIHPFKDGNTRTFVMLLLPFLLHELGLGKICVFDDPNRFWLYSVEELIQEVIQALRNGQELAAEEECYLSEFLDTESMLAAFSSEQQEYFEQCYKQYKKIALGEGYALTKTLAFHSNERLRTHEFFQPLDIMMNPELEPSKKRSHSDTGFCENKKQKLSHKKNEFRA